MLSLNPPFFLAPMAGMTDTAFRRLVKRQGGCGLVVTEMVSSEGLVRGIGRTLQYAEYTEEERPVAVQIFGGDPEKMAEAARIVEGMGADVVDVNMGCPVPKIAKHNAGCSLMREPEHAASVVAAMVRAVQIPVTVKMRAGWNERQVNAPLLARMIEDAGAAAVAVHGRTAAQSYSGASDWDLIARVAEAVTIPVFGNGDCIEAEQIVERLQSSGVSGILIGRGVLRNPWILGQAADLLAGRSRRQVTLAERGRFLLDYIDLLLNERVNEPHGFRHEAPGWSTAERAEPAEDPESGVAAGLEPGRPLGDDESALPAKESVVAAGLQPCRAPSERSPDRASAQRLAPCAQSPAPDPPPLSRRPLAKARGRDKEVINKLRALAAWYTKGLEGGSHLRTAINHTESLDELRVRIQRFFVAGDRGLDAGCGWHRLDSQQLGS